MKRWLTDVASLLVRGRRVSVIEVGPKRRFAQVIAPLAPFRSETLALAGVVGVGIGWLVALRAIVHPWAYPTTGSGFAYAILHFAGGVLAGTCAGLGIIASTLWRARPLPRLIHGGALCFAGLVLGGLLPLAFAGELAAPIAVGELNPAGYRWRPPWLPAHAMWPEPVKDAAWYTLEVLLLAIGWSTHRVLLPTRRTLARLAAGIAFFACASATLYAFFARWMHSYVAYGTPYWGTRAVWVTVTGVLMLIVALGGWYRIVVDRHCTTDRRALMPEPVSCAEHEGLWAGRWEHGSEAEQRYFRTCDDAVAWCEQRWLDARAGTSVLLERDVSGRWTPARSLEDDGDGGFAWSE